MSTKGILTDAELVIVAGGVKYYFPTYNTKNLFYRGGYEFAVFCTTINRRRVYTPLWYPANANALCTKIGNKTYSFVPFDNTFNLRGIDLQYRFSQTTDGIFIYTGLFVSVGGVTAVLKVEIKIEVINNYSGAVVNTYYWRNYESNAQPYYVDITPNRAPVPPDPINIKFTCNISDDVITKSIQPWFLTPQDLAGYETEIDIHEN